MSNLGFDALTDDQIVELAHELAVEMVKRSPDVVTAGQRAVQSAVDAARNSQDHKWAVKKWLATMCDKLFDSPSKITLWKSPDGSVVQIYFEASGNDRRGRENIKYTYHVTGSAKYAPGSLCYAGNSRTSDQKNLHKYFFILAHEILRSGETFVDVRAAVKTAYAIPALPAAWLEAEVADAEAERVKTETAERRKAWLERRIAHLREFKTTIPAYAEATRLQAELDAMPRVEYGCEGYDAYIAARQQIENDASVAAKAWYAVLDVEAKKWDAENVFNS